LKQVGQAKTQYSYISEHYFITFRKLRKQQITYDSLAFDDTIADVGKAKKQKKMKKMIKRRKSLQQAPRI